MNEFIKNNKEILDVLINFFIALGTCSTVLIAIFGNSIKNYFKKPKLSISIDTKLNRQHKEETVSQSSCEIQKTQSYIYNLKVDNTGKGIAKHTQVTIDEIYKLRSDGQAWEVIHHFFSTPFLWQNDNDNHDIWHKTSAYIKLLEVKEMISDESGDFNSDLQEDGITNSLQMQLYLINKVPNIQLVPGTYRFEMKICTNDMKPLSKYIEIFLKEKTGIDQLENRTLFNIKEIKESEFRQHTGGDK